MNTISSPWYQIKEKENVYAWPDKVQIYRSIALFDDDILTKDADGAYTKHTGVVCKGIETPDEDLIVFNSEKDYVYNKKCFNCGDVDGQGENCRLIITDDGWKVACPDCGIADYFGGYPTPKHAVYFWESLWFLKPKN